MGEKVERAQVRLGARGRVLIPIHVRRALNLQPGDRLVARLKGSRLELESHAAILNRLQSHFRHIPAGVSLADELIAERREAARQEALD